MPWEGLAAAAMDTGHGAVFLWPHKRGPVAFVPCDVAASALVCRAGVLGPHAQGSPILRQLGGPRGVFRVSVKGSIFNSWQKNLKEVKSSLMLVAQKPQPTLPNRSVQDCKSLGGVKGDV